MDKEYTGIDKEAMCICGDFAGFSADLGASFAAKVASEIGCDELLVVVWSDAEFAQPRSSVVGVASAAPWSAAS